jgi:hypothetical protein
MNQLKGVDPKFIEFYKKEIEGKIWLQKKIGREFQN